MQNTYKNINIVALIGLTVACILLSINIGASKTRIEKLEKQVADMAPVVVEAYNGQNYLGKVLYEVGMLDKNADGTGVIINPALPLRSAQQAGVMPQ